MQIAIVTNFPQEFQWDKVWTKKRQLNNKVSVVSIKATPSDLAGIPTDDPYWIPLRNADVVFVHCARYIFHSQYSWFKFLFEVKALMKSKSKMIVQFDSEFIWLINPDGIQWKAENDLREYVNVSPKKFFAKTRILDIADAYFTLLEKPFWAKYCTKPIYYMPLPQLVRYKLKSLYNSSRKNGTVALLRHNARGANIEHTIRNVTNPLEKAVSIFTCSTTRSQSQCVKYIRQLNCPRKSLAFGFLFGDSYLDVLQKCYIAIDDAEGYMGWSRFSMECAFLSIPCIGSSYATKIFFTELYTEHKDYVKQRKLVQRLFDDKEFYKRMAEVGRRRVLEYMDSDKLCKRFVEFCRKIYK